MARISKPSSTVIIDCHTHWHSDWGEGDPSGPSKWLGMMDRHGVRYAIVLPTRGLMDDAQLVKDNDDVARVCRLSHGRMIPFCTVNPFQGDHALKELERCIHQLGCRGIKFHPWMQGVSPNHPLMDKISEMAATAEIPIFFHDGTPPFSLPSQIGLLARRHPKTTFVLGHCGLLEFWMEAIMVLRQCENVWGCLCSPHPGAMREILRHAPIDKLCWGSDFGFGVTDIVGYRLGLLRCTGEVEAILGKIFSDNPRNLLGLPI